MPQPVGIFPLEQVFLSGDRKPKLVGGSDPAGFFGLRPSVPLVGVRVRGLDQVWVTSSVSRSPPWSGRGCLTPDREFRLMTSVRAVACTHQRALDTFPQSA